MVDDGSIDNPRGATVSDPRIVWLEQPPSGIVAALERGRKQCKNQFIARLDADDVALPGRITAQMAMMRSDPQIGAVGGRAELVDEAGPVRGGMQFYVDWVNRLDNLHAQLLVESPLFHPASLIRASALASVGGYRDGDLPEDYDLWLRLDLAGFRLVASKRTVVRIRDHGARLTRTDPRYRKDAFDAVKHEWLRLGPLRRRHKVVIWGAGRTGKRWIRRLLADGHDVCAVIDIQCRTERQGVPVYGPDQLRKIDFEYLFVAVGARGARDTIRGQLNGMNLGLVEGRDWWALA